MILIYVAGPYRADSVWALHQNIAAARKIGAVIAQCGAYPVIPHSNTAFFDGCAPDRLFLQGTLALMKKCDGVVFTHNWRTSIGAREEMRQAKMNGIPFIIGTSKVGKLIRDIGGFHGKFAQ